MVNYAKADLFGGAITCLLPTTFADVSDIRQVPDHQEVWLDKDGFTNVIIEILERVEKPDLEALQYHLEGIVEEDWGDMRVWGQGEAHLDKMP